jgi:hypothetical protein
MEDVRQRSPHVALNLQIQPNNLQIGTSVSHVGLTLRTGIHQQRAQWVGKKPNHQEGFTRKTA